MKKIIPIIACFLFILFATASLEAKNTIKIGSDTTVEKNQQTDNVIVIGGQATINGLVEQNVVVVGGSVVLTNNAVVRGNVVCIGGVVAKGNGSQVFGNITEIDSTNISSVINSAIKGDWDGWPWIFAIASICFLLVLITVAFLIVLIIPKPIIAVSAAISGNKGRSFLWGILGILLIAPLAVLLVISLIGIPLIPLEFTIVAVALVIGFIAAGSLFGKFVLVKIFKRNEPGLVKATLLGLLVLWLIGWIPFNIGWIVKSAVAIIGLGGVLITLFDHRPKPAAPTQSTSETHDSKNSSLTSE
jgi:hypothetical protein